MPCNVVLLVLDTLRIDHSSELDELLEVGFTKVPDAISPSSWTLPSHVSMMTGKLPSQHGIHEARDTRPRNLTGIARSEVATAETNLLNIAGRQGYTSFCATGNPFISPMYGFNFDHHHEFGTTGEISTQALEMTRQGRSDMQVALGLARKGKLRDFFRLLDYRLKQEAGRVIKLQQLEKGSKYIADFAKRTQFPTPFFLFVNLMEAHEAYVWGEDFMRTVGLSVLGRGPDSSWWRDAYPRHAELAIAKGKEIVSALLKYDPLIIVTSDHGQLLGEGGRYGHGYSLDDVLIRVPFYIRYPRSGARLEKDGRYLSLGEVPGIVSSVIRGEPRKFGSSVAVSESFGYPNDLSRYVNDGDADRLDRLFQARTRVFAEDGTVTYNWDTRAIEERTGSLTEDRAKVLLESVPHATRARDSVSTGMDKPDEEAVLARLRKLGYE